MNRELMYRLMKMPLTWLGIILIATSLAVVIRQPIQVDKWYWTQLANVFMAYAVGGLGAIIIGFRIIAAHKAST